MSKKIMGVLLLGCVFLFSSCEKVEKQAEELFTKIPVEAEEKQEVTKEPEKVQKEEETSDPIVLAIDAGHGGNFGGAVYDGRVEKTLNLKVAEYLKAYLEENYTGVTAFLTRDSDAALSDDVAEDLKLRAKAAKDADADAFISLHFNATDDHSQSGAMIFVSNQEMVHDTCNGLAEAILKNLVDLGLSDDGIRTRNSNDLKDENGKPLDYYAVNRNAAAYQIPAIIVEHCYLDNENDVPFVADEEAVKALAVADAKGIAEYYQLKEK